VFQFTADGARNFCLEAKPDSIEEQAALTAI
jgi:DNA polymerase III alpha subunit